MTGRYSPRMPILGTTLGTYRKVLKAWTQGRDLSRMPRGLGLSPETVALIVDDAEARGLVGRFGSDRDPDHGYGLSPAGKTLLTASASARMSPYVARGLLDGLVANAVAMNADKRNPVKVERIWLFGSLARDEADMGDVDVAIELRDSPRDDAARRVYAKRAIELAYRLGGGYAVGRAEFKDWAARDYIEKRCLFGERKDPRIKNHPVWDLANLACPCKLVFDDARGGPVSDPLLDRHPESSGRGRRPVRGAMPDMSVPAPAVPTSIEIAVAHATPVLEAGDRYRTIGYGALPPDIERMTGEDVAEWMRAVPALDGRSTALVTDRGGFRSGDPMIAVHLGRSLLKGHGPSISVEGAISSTGGEPTREQVERLGILVAEACRLDMGKTRLSGMEGSHGPETALYFSDDAPGWAAGIVRAAARDLQRHGIFCTLGVKEGTPPEPAMR